MRRGGEPGAQQLSYNQRKERERRLKQKLLNGELVHGDDELMMESMRYMNPSMSMENSAGAFASSFSQQFAAEGAEQQPAKTLASLAAERGVGYTDEDESESASGIFNDHDLGQSKKLMDRAKQVAKDATSSLGHAKVTSTEERDAKDQKVFREYERLQAEQEELELARKDLGVDRFEGNFLGIENALGGVDENGKEGEPNFQALGNWEAYNKVQDMLNKFVFRRNAGGAGMDINQPQYMELIKNKLNDAREQIDMLRRKVKDTQTALKNAVLESRSAQQLLADRNEDLGRLRKEVSTMQLQLRHYKQQRTSTKVHLENGAVVPGSKEELILQMEQLRNDFDTLAEANWQLEQDNKMLRLKLEFKPKRERMEREREKELEEQRRAKEMPKVDTNDTTARKKLMTDTMQHSAGAVMKLKQSRQAMQRRVAKMEASVMELYDVDANSCPSETFSPHLGLSKGGSFATMKGGPGALLTPLASKANLHPLISPNEQLLSAHHRASPAVSEGGHHSRPGSTQPRSPRHLAKHDSMTRTPQDVSLQEDDSSDKATPHDPSLGTSNQSPAQLPVGWRDTSKAWMALREKVLTAVACNRADVLRREDAHIRRMRHKMSLMAQDLLQIGGERDLLQEKASRLEGELAEAKDNLTLAKQRADKLASTIETVHNQHSKLQQPQQNYYAGQVEGSGNTVQILKETIVVDGSVRLEGGPPTAGDAGSPTIPVQQALPAGTGSVADYTAADAADTTGITVGDRNLAGDDFLARAKNVISKRREEDAHISAEQADKKIADLEGQLEVMSDIFQAKVDRLENELRSKNGQVDDLMRLVQQNAVNTSGGEGTASGNATVTEIIESTNPAVGGTAATETKAIKRLEKSVIKKDQELHDNEVEMKKMRVQLNAAQDIITEERAVVNLGLSKKCAARVVSVIRRWLQRVRENLGTAVDNDAYEEGEENDVAQSVIGSPAVNRNLTTSQFSADGRSEAAGGRVRGIKAEDAALQRNAAVAEDDDEELAILEQIMGLVKNPVQKEHVAKQISLLELADDADYSSQGRAIAKREKDWCIIRQLWLRLIALREQQWQDAMTEEMRKKFELRLIDTYEAFLRFEQNDSSESKPSIASNGAMRVVSMAASPISQEGGIRSADEVEREFVALMELVRSRTSQLLQLEADRDELLAKIEKLASQKASKKATVPPSALIVRHEVQGNETPALIGGTYGITNLQLIREFFHQGHRAADGSCLSGKTYLPIKTLNALNIVCEAYKDCKLVIRRLVLPSDTIGSIAALYHVTSNEVCGIGCTTSLEELAEMSKSNNATPRNLPGDDDSRDALEESSGFHISPHRVSTGGASRQATVDVVVQKTVAAKHVFQPHPDLITEQVPVSVFAVLPTDDVQSRTIARHINVDEDEVLVNNVLLEQGSVLDIPLIITPFTAAIVPDMIGRKEVAVLHMVGLDDTIGSVAERYGVFEDNVVCTDSQLRARTQVPVLLPNLDRLYALVKDPAVQAMVKGAAKQAQEKQQQEDIKARRRKNSMYSSSEEDDDEAQKTKFAPISGLQRGRTQTIAIRGDVSGSGIALSTRAQSLRRRKSLGTSAMAAVSGSYHYKDKEDQEIVDHVLFEKVDLLTVAKQYGCLREDISVPNFSLLHGFSAEWLVRLRDQTGISTAREMGSEVHCLVPVVDEKLQALAAAFSVSEDLLVRSNEDVLLSRSEDSLSGHIRIPLLNNKVQQLCLKRSGDVYAVCSARGHTVTSIAQAYGVQPSDVSAFNVQLDPAITRNVLIAKRNPAGSGKEFRVQFNFHTDIIDVSSFTLPQLAKVRAGFEHDVLGVCDFASSACKDGGQVSFVQCIELTNESVFTAQVVTSTRAVAVEAERLLNEEGQYAHLDGTRTAMIQVHDSKEKREAAEAALPTVIPLVPYGSHIYALGTGYADSALKQLAEGDTFASLALRFSVGVDTLIACNPDVYCVMLQPHDTDKTQDSLAGIHDLLVPGATRSLAVAKGDTIHDMAQRARITPMQLRRENMYQIPLHLFSASVRIPVPYLDDHPTMLVRNHTAESILSFCTRMHCSADQVFIDQLDVAVGAMLKIPPRCSLTFSENNTVAFNPQTREHLVHRGDNLETLAAQFGCLIQELVICNASNVRLVPGCICSIPVRVNPDVSNPHTGFIVRHPVQKNETLGTISSNYFQPVTTVMNVNQELFHARGAHLIFIPVAEDDRNDMLTTHMTNLFTIVVPGAYDTKGSLARKFAVPPETVNEVNALLQEERRIIVPVASPTALSLVRQQNLMLFISVELQLKETLVSVADRHNVFVKDLMILGKPLLDVNISQVDIPVSFDVAKKLLTQPQCKHDRIFYQTEMHGVDTLAFISQDMHVQQEEITMMNRASTAVIPTHNNESLQNARTREMSKMIRRSEMVSQTLQIGHAIRKLNERNDATRRELEKVEVIRAQMEAQKVERAKIVINTDEIGTQTDKDDDKEKRVRQKRHNQTQTKMIADQIDNMEKTYKESLVKSSVANADIVELKKQIEESQKMHEETEKKLAQTTQLLRVKEDRTHTLEKMIAGERALSRGQDGGVMGGAEARSGSISSTPLTNTLTPGQRSRAASMKSPPSQDLNATSGGGHRASFTTGTDPVAFPTSENGGSIAASQQQPAALRRVDTMSGPDEGKLVPTPPTTPPAERPTRGAGQQTTPVQSEHHMPITTTTTATSAGMNPAFHSAEEQPTGVGMGTQASDLRILSMEQNATQTSVGPTPDKIETHSVGLGTSRVSMDSAAQQTSFPGSIRPTPPASVMTAPTPTNRSVGKSVSPTQLFNTGCQTDDVVIAPAGFMLTSPGGTPAAPSLQVAAKTPAPPGKTAKSSTNGGKTSSKSRTSSVASKEGTSGKRASTTSNASTGSSGSIAANRTGRSPSMKHQENPLNSPTTTRARSTSNSSRTSNGSRTSSTTRTAVPPAAAVAAAAGDHPDTEKRRVAEDNLRNVKQRVAVQAKRLSEEAFQIRGKCDEIRMLLSGAFSDLQKELTEALMPLTSMNVADLLSATERAQIAQENQIEKRVVEGIASVTKQLAPDLNNLFSQARKKRQESLMPFLNNQKVTTSEEDSMNSEDWLQKRLADYVSQQIQAGQLQMPAAGDDDPMAQQPSRSGATSVAATAGGAASDRAPSALPAVQPPRRQSAETGSAMPKSFAGKTRDEFGFGPTPPSRPLSQPTMPAGGSTSSLPPINAKDGFGTPSRPATNDNEEERLRQLQRKPSAAALALSKMLELQQPTPTPSASGIGSGASSAAPGAQSPADSAWSNIAFAEPSADTKKVAKSRRGQSQLSTLYQDLQSQLVSLVENEQKQLAVEEEQRRLSSREGGKRSASVADDVAEEVLPVLAVMNQLKNPTDSGPRMSEVQKEQVAEIREVDQKLRKESAKIAFKTLQTRLRMKKMMDTYGALDTQDDRDAVLKITGLWRTWLKKWTKRRTTIETDRRQNMARLVNIFVMLEDEYVRKKAEEDAAGEAALRGENYIRSLQGGGGGPTLDDSAIGLSPEDSPTAERVTKFGEIKQGIIVLKKHRPGSKFLAIEKPVDDRAASPSSKHFRGVNFEPPPPDPDAHYFD